MANSDSPWTASVYCPPSYSRTIAMMAELTWSERIEKHGYGIDPDESPSELNDYVATKLHVYEVEGFMDDTLWGLFQEDFEGFTVDTFQKLQSSLRSKLRTHLLQRGVYVQPYSKGLTISQTLYDVLQEYEQRQWTDKEVADTANKLELLSRPLKIQLARITATQAPVTPLDRPVRNTGPGAITPGPTPGPAPRLTSFASGPAPGSAYRPVRTAQSPVVMQSRNISPTPASQLPINYSKEVATIAKVYTDEQKYGGTDDSFDFKLVIFQDICNRSGLPPENYMMAFPIMLKGFAQSHYYNCGLSMKSYDVACIHMRSFFEGPEYYRKNLTEWNSITLQDFIDSNPDKSVSECLQLLIDKLCKQQHAIDPELRTQRTLTNKLVTACQGVPACRIAISNPSEELSTLINKLQSSVIAWEKETPRTTASYFTDRRYYRGPQQRRTDRNVDRNEDSKLQRNQTYRKARCYICKREDCRSWNHSDTDRNKVRAKWKEKFNSRTNGRLTNQSDDRFSQYVALYEGDSDTSSDIDDIFEELVLNTEPSQDSTTTASTDMTATTTTSSSYLTMYGELEPVQAAALTNTLADRAFNHWLDPTVEHTNACSYAASDIKSRYNSDNFMGIVVDTGASTKSTVGRDQFLALQRIIPSLRLDTSTKGQVNVQFGVGHASSIGTATVQTPIGEVQFHVVEPSTPFLLSLADMDRLHAYLDNTRNVLVTPKGEVSVVRRFGHAFLLHDSSLQAYLLESLSQDPCYLSEIELRRLHRRFGHPSVDRLHRVLERTGHDHDRAVLERLNKYCHFCQKYGRAPGRFRFVVQDDIEFNYNIIVDIMYISGSPILHIVDEATRFQAGRWLLNISAKHTWETLQACWIDTYLGPPDCITTDAGKNFISREFTEYASTLSIRIKAVPVEAHNSIGMVERYHGPVRRIYQIICTELPHATREVALQMTFKAINDTAGPGGLVPTLLVFGAYPRMSDMDPPAPTVVQRANAVRKAMAEVRKLRAKRQVTEALQLRNGPSVSSVHGLPPNSDVLVWREGNTGQPGHWDGPYKLLTIEGETCTVQIGSSLTAFRSTVVKPYYQDKKDNSRTAMPIQDDPEPVRTAQPEIRSSTQPEQPRPPETSDSIALQPELEPIESEPENTITVQPVRPLRQPIQPTQPVEQPTQPIQPKRGRGRPRKYPLLTALTDITIFVQDENKGHQFEASRQKELTGLLEKGVFEVTRLQDVPPGIRLFNSRFVDEVKNLGTSKAFEKSRLVVQAYNDQEKSIVLTQSPTIQRVSQRLILCTAAIGVRNSKLYLRDISQAYVQSTTALNRQFYVRPPPELRDQLSLNEDTVLKVLKPLYGVPEAGNHWFKTYQSHHINQLHMSPSSYDLCLLQSNDPFGVIGLQTDDTLILGEEAFAALEQEKLVDARFLSKEREELTAETPFKFNGGLIQLTDEGVSLTQTQHCKNLCTIATHPVTSTGTKSAARTLAPEEQYIAQRARGAYIASVCQPEACFDLSFAAQVSNPSKDDYQALNKRLDWQIKNAERGLKFVRLDVSTLQLLVFTDASFANNKDLSSQIGYVIVLADAAKRANIVHWSSVKCKRITRSVLASELYATAHGFDIGIAIKSTVDRILQVNLPLILCTDSKSLYDCIVRLGTTQEKRLMIDVMCLRQAYETRLITEVRWIRGESNPADAMTKAKPCTALTQLIDTNIINVQAEGWVERTITG